MSDEAKANNHKPKVARSPRYPGVPLERAIALTRRLQEEEGQYPAPLHNVLEHWGFSKNSGPGRIALAAVRNFGLVTTSGTGRDKMVAVSPLGLDIVLDDREVSEERDQAIQRAALLPQIHREVWEHLEEDLPPGDGGFRHYLLRERGFTSKGADGFIAQFRATVEFAGLAGSDRIASEEVENAVSDERLPAPRRETAARGRSLDPEPAQQHQSASQEAKPMPEIQHESQDLTIPIGGGQVAILRAPAKITAQQYHFLTTYFTAMKEAIITAPIEPQVPNASDEEN